MQQADLDRWHMARAIALAAQGQGAVEPNPQVGCLIVRGAEIIGEGWHRRYGGPHAEIEALQVAGPRARGATLYVTLEPCCHHGKTPPCVDAILASGARRVVAAMADPNPLVGGQGLARLREAGLDVVCGVLEAEASRLMAPYVKLLSTGKPWVIAKWAMTLDGKIASRTADARWISSPPSRALVHKWRGEIDAIIVGRGTVVADDPLLTARPSGARVPLRVALDSRAALSLETKLVQTAWQTPLLVVVGPQASADRCQALRRAGAEVLTCRSEAQADRWDELLTELGRRRHTNVMVEGGGQTLGTLFERRSADEVRVFVAPRLLGGETAVTPVAGCGPEKIADALRLIDARWQPSGDDLLLTGRIDHNRTVAQDVAERVL